MPTHFATGRQAARSQATLVPASSLPALVSAAQVGDEIAREALFDRCLPLLQRWAAQLIPPRLRGVVEAPDVAQDAAMDFLRNLDRFGPRHEHAVEAYLRRIVANRIVDQMRRFARRGVPDELAVDLPAQGPTPYDTAEQAERVRRYRRALQRLHPHQMALVESRYHGCHSYAEIARCHGKPSADAARMAVRRAVDTIAAELRGTGEARVSRTHARRFQTDWKDAASLLSQRDGEVDTDRVLR